MNLLNVARRSAYALLAATAVGGCTLLPAAREAPLQQGAGAIARAQASPSAGAFERREPAAKRDRPPDGVMSSDGGPAVAGSPGSYCYGDTCADIAEWPPKSKLPALTATGKLRFKLEGDEPFIGWHASYSKNAKDDRATELASEGSAFDPDSSASPPPSISQAVIKPPPVGDWVVWVSIDLEHGDLSYAWRVVVLPDTATE